MTKTPRRGRDLAEPQAKFATAPAAKSAGERRGHSRPRAASSVIAGTWPLQRAKTEFSRVVDQAIAKGPQAVTRHGKDVVVVLSRGEFDRLAGTKARPDFVSFLMSMPKSDEFDRIMRKIVAERRAMSPRTGS
jgi:antitoxin Phd